ncbi:hypothetical protein [Candidatus Electronema sp. PJ]|uniref:hypothetical protein n=1 Tax=Candidatus Electronema sp. PJ TaxID=3401572 RepID=UPI003AA89893
MDTSRWWFLGRLGMEPPFRLLVKALLRQLNVSVRTRALWDISKRPTYLLGVLTAAEQARKQKISEISVIEFGVAAGDGLVTLQSEAEAVERETGIGIKVYGFDAGPQQGLPAFIGDYRDHPEAWQPGDYPMNESALRALLTKRTTLILGNVKDTVPGFFQNFQPPPIGFVSFDLDLYSSTKEALQIFCVPDKKMLWHVPLYFDDIDFLFNHKFAGELLAIEEFNQESSQVKIDKWHGVRIGRPFKEMSFLEKLYVAHDLEAISQVALNRHVAMLPLRNTGKGGSL